MGRFGVKAAITLGALSWIGAGTAGAQAPETEIEQAAKLCRAEEYLADGGHTIVFDGLLDSDTAGVLAAACVTGELLPDWMVAVLSSTTSLWGLVRNEIGDYLVLNSYHPDNGLFLVITESDYAPEVGIPDLGVTTVDAANPTDSASASLSPAEAAAAAEDLIDDDLGDLTEETGVNFAASECEPPADVAVGTTFKCVAFGNDRNVWVVTASVGDTGVLIEEARIRS